MPPESSSNSTNPSQSVSHSVSQSQQSRRTKASRYVSRAPGGQSRVPGASKAAAASRTAAAAIGRGKEHVSVVVRNADGVDITPKSLLTKPGGAPQNLVAGGGDLEMLTSMSEQALRPPSARARCCLSSPPPLPTHLPHATRRSPTPSLAPRAEGRSS